MSLRQKVISGTIWSAIDKWGAQLVSTSIFLLLARFLGAEAFGLVALANVFLAFMQIFLDQGFAQAIIQREVLEPEHLDTAFWTSVLMGLFFLLAVSAGAGWVATFYNEPTLAPVIRWMSVSFLFGGLSSVQAAILKREMRFKAFAIRSSTATITCGIAGIGAAIAGLGLWSLVIKEIVFGLTGAIALWRVSDWRPRFKFSSAHFKDLFSYGINIIGLNILNFFNLRADDMLIGYFLGPIALGYYSVAYRLLLIMIKLLTNVTNQVALPMFSRMQDDPDRLRRSFYKVTQYTSLIAFPTFIAMAILAPEFVNVLFGEAWMPSVPVMRILAFSGILQSVYQFNGTILLSTGKPAWRLGLQGLDVVCNIAAFLCLVNWGIVAVATGFVVGGYVRSPLSLLLVKKIIHIDVAQYLSRFLPAMTASAAMVVTLLTLQSLIKGWISSDALFLPIVIILSSLIYGLTLNLVSPHIIKELRGYLSPKFAFSK